MNSQPNPCPCDCHPDENPCGRCISWPVHRGTVQPNICPACGTPNQECDPKESFEGTVQPPKPDTSVVAPPCTAWCCIDKAKYPTPDTTEQVVEKPCKCFNDGRLLYTYKCEIHGDGSGVELADTDSEFKP